jgi:enoyl-CoA hydratase/carnithine racemase
VIDSDEPLVIAREGPVTTLWLNRPAKRNAVTRAMWAGITEMCAVLAADSTVRVLVVRGAGGHFCGGADIGDLDAGDASYGHVNRDAEAALATFPKPTIAFVTGACVGGGAEIAIACDRRIADTSATFGITPARLGIVYPAFAVERAVRLIGPAATKHLLFTGDLIDGSAALAVGLIDELHEPAAALTRLQALTTVLASERSLLTQMAAKAMIDEIASHGSVSRETEIRWAAELNASGDAAEGVAAFFERRPPRFTWAGPSED